MVADFGQQVAQRMAGSGAAVQPGAAPAISPVRTLLGLLLDRLRALFRPSR
jgi:hypothetical protein